MPQIPFELSDYIIDFLHGDARALRACALTCHAWAPAARFHHFRTVALQNRNFSILFEHLLRTTPDLGWYVRELTVSKFAEAGSLKTPSTSNFVEPSVLENTLPHILSHLPSLQAVSLSHTDMKCIPDLARLKHSSVTKLSLAYCQFAEFSDVVALVSSFPHLTDLSLSGLTWKEETRPCTPTPIPTLRTLTLGRDMDSDRLFDWFAAAAFHTSITSLAARCASEGDTSLVGPFIALAGASLRQLDLDWSVSGDKVVILPDTVSLAECGGLESLALHFPVHYCTSVPWVTSLLDTLAAASLRSVTFDVRLLGNIDALDWAGLGALLASEPYRSLGEIRFAVNLWTGVHKTFEEVDGLIRAHLPAFDKKGMLHITKT